MVYGEGKKTKHDKVPAVHTREVRTKKKPAKRRAFELLNKMFNARVHRASAEQPVERNLLRVQGCCNRKPNDVPQE